MRTPAAVVLLACAFAACGGATRGRAPRLVSPEVSVDQALDRAAREADDGDLAEAGRVLEGVLSRAPNDALAALARVSLARYRVALDDLPAAEAQLARVPTALDPALTMRRDLVAGIVHARLGRTEQGMAALRPLARRMIDRGDSVEADCAVASLEARAGRPVAALAALARIEALAEAGARWLPTGLACDAAGPRGDAFRELVARVDDPAALADTIDALPAGHALRVDAAQRLRAIAAARNEIPRWLRWLADLPDTEATLRVVSDAVGPPPLRVGLLAPTSGAAARVGASALRAVQIALEGERAVEIETADEGATREEAVAGFDRLAALRVAAVIGPATEDHAAAVAARAEASGVDVMLVAPHLDAPPASGHVVLAGPALRDRAVALAGAVRQRGTHVRLVAAPGTERDLFTARLRESLARASVGVAAGEGAGGAGELRLVVGPWGEEARASLAERARAAPGRWVFDARRADVGAPGVWVGVAAADEVAVAGFRARFCELTGAAPDELSLLAWEAARAVAARVRARAYAPAAGPPWQLRAAATDDGDGALAVTRRCPVAGATPAQ
ncbi:MAG: hypothetical protein U0324_46590 [Polyangiales bacterium]